VSFPLPAFYGPECRSDVVRPQRLIRIGTSRSLVRGNNADFPQGAICLGEGGFGRVSMTETRADVVKTF
jgi:hypothetical protein